MKKIQNTAYMLLSLIFLCPAALWATRGPDDYGLFMGFIFLFFSIPAGVTMVVFIIISCVRLFRKDVTAAKRGQSMLRLSLTVAALSVVIAALFIGNTVANYNVITTILVVLLPVFLLAGIAAVLAWYTEKNGSQE